MKNKLLLLMLKEKKIIFSGIIIGFSLFLAYSIFFYVPLFSTYAKLFVRNIQKQDIITPYNGGSIVQSESGYSNPLFNLVQIIQSEEVASKVYDKTKIKYADDFKKFGINSKEHWYGIYSKLVKAKIEPSTDIITISFNWNNSKNAEDLLNIIVKEFKDTNLQIRKSVEIKQREYLDKQVISIGNQLDNIRKQIRNYKLKTKAIDVTNESTELTRARVDLEKQAEILRSDISYQNKKLSDFGSQLGFTDAKTVLRATAIGQDLYLLKLTQDLASAQQNYAKLQAKFTNKYPDVTAAKEEIHTISNNIQNREKESLSTVHINRGLYDGASQNIATDMSRVQAEKNSLIARYITLQRGINQLKSKEGELPGKILGLEELQKQEEALLIAYTNAKQKQMEARIKENQIVDNIFPLNEKISPVFLINRLLMKLIGFAMFGFLGATGIAWVKEDIENKWRNSKEIEDITGQKVLGVLPWVKSKTASSIRFLYKPSSIMGIAFSNIASNISSKSYIDEAQVISFISTNISRENSSIVPNVSFALARLDKSVILVNTDFSSPSKLLKNITGAHFTNTNDIIDIINEVNKYIRLSKTADSQPERLFEIIARSLETALIPINIKMENGESVVLNYLCTNKKIENINNYVATRGFKAIIEFLKHHYEFVLVDTPAKPLIYPEFSSIVNISDAVTIISSMDTNREALIKIVDKFTRSNIKILGIVPREVNSEIEHYYNLDNSRIRLSEIKHSDSSTQKTI